MPAAITLAVMQGHLPAKKYVFSDRSVYLVGRDGECHLAVPPTDDNVSISRLHCLLDICPPDIRIKDLGSKFGTFVNDRKIGQRESEDQRGKPLFPEHDLKDQDTVRLGDPTMGDPIVFRVHISVPAYCAECSAEIPDGDRDRLQQAPGVYRCAACRAKGKSPKVAPSTHGNLKRCAQCGRDVSREMGDNRRGDFICAACRANPAAGVEQLLERAKSGSKDLLAIQGYEVLKELGKGGMGAVYQARHKESGEVVALKVMLPKVAANDDAITRFLREMEYTKALRHPHIVQLRSFGCSQGTFFFTLEFCAGGSVDKLMEQRGRTLSIEEAAPIVLRALAGLEYAHNATFSVRRSDGSTTQVRGLVHRDLKPANLFLAGSGKERTAKVGDYGLAKAFDQNGLSGPTATGDAAGTLPFMPRQQLINFKYAKPEVDVWAMAASFYFMLTGDVPRDFSQGQNPVVVIMQSDAIPIRQRNPAVPKKLAQVIDRALIDKPAILIQTAAEFKQELERALR